MVFLSQVLLLASVRALYSLAPSSWWRHIERFGGIVGGRRGSGFWPNGSGIYHKQDDRTWLVSDWPILLEGSGPWFDLFFQIWAKAVGGSLILRRALSKRTYT